MPTIDKTNHFARPPSERNSTAKRELRQYFYHTRQWRKLRSVYLADHPLCEMCLARDEYTPATDVHHRETFTGKGDRWREWALNYNNLMAVCKVCHGKIHRAEQDNDPDI